MQEKKFPTAPRHPRDVPSALPRPIPGIQKKVFTAPRTFRPTRKQRNIVVQGYSPFEMQNPNYWLQFSSIWNYHSNKKQGWQSLARFDDLLMVRVEKTRKVSGKRKWELGYAVYLGTSPEGSVLLRWLTEPNESPPEYFEVRRIFRPLWK
ncbi:MAG: hypothetical protein HY393_02810 [Candidatus Diapherotrites archaeon]|nr:hypothetical protein [Candidatus Diapherotrites archaeon]